MVLAAASGVGPGCGVLAMSGACVVAGWLMFRGRVVEALEEALDISEVGDCHADVQAQIVWKTTQTSNDHVSIGVLPSNHKVGNPAYGRRGRWHPGLWPHRRQNLDLLSESVCTSAQPVFIIV